MCLCVQEHVLFVPVTLCLIVLCYVVSVGVPGIWVVLSFVGSCASTFMGFVFPALVIYIMNVSRDGTSFLHTHRPRDRTKCTQGPAFAQTSALVGA